MILSSTLLPIFTILLSLPNTLAHPTTDDLSLQLHPRSNPGDSKSNPIKAEIEIRGEDALTYDVDCWAMLCKGKSAVMYASPSSISLSTPFPRQTTKPTTTTS